MLSQRQAIYCIDLASLLELKVLLSQLKTVWQRYIVTL